MSIVLDKNNQLLRKIMEKMEIHTEEEAWDEGGGPDDSENEMKIVTKCFKKRSSAQETYIKSAVLDLWKGKKK